MPRNLFNTYVHNIFIPDTYLRIFYLHYILFSIMYLKKVFLWLKKVSFKYRFLCNCVVYLQISIGKLLETTFLMSTQLMNPHVRLLVRRLDGPSVSRPLP